MLFPGEQLVLMLLMAGWVMYLSPGSVWVQAMCRLFAVLALVAMSAFVLTASDFFRTIGATAMLGTVTGIVLRFLFFPETPGHSFSRAMIPAVEGCETYFVATMAHWLEEVPEAADNPSFEKIWQKLPEWVNFRGFDSRLAPGYQFFMQRLSEVGDVLFALHFLSRKEQLGHCPDFLRAEFSDCVLGVRHLFSDILNTLRHHDTKPGLSDFSDKLVLLEKKIRGQIPSGAEWQATHHHWLMLADVVCCFEDLRWLQLKLTEVLNTDAGRFPQVALKDLSLPESTDQHPTLSMNHHKAHGGDEADNPKQN